MESVLHTHLTSVQPSENFCTTKSFKSECHCIIEPIEALSLQISVGKEISKQFLRGMT